MVKRLNAYKVINQLTKITFFINVTKFFRKKRKKITTIRIEVIFQLPLWVMICGKYVIFSLLR